MGRLRLVAFARLDLAFASWRCTALRRDGHLRAVGTGARPFCHGPEPLPHRARVFHTDRLRPGLGYVGSQVEERRDSALRDLGRRAPHSRRRSHVLVAARGDRRRPRKRHPCRLPHAGRGARPRTPVPQGDSIHAPTLRLSARELERPAPAPADDRPSDPLRSRAATRPRRSALPPDSREHSGTASRTST